MIHNIFSKKHGSFKVIVDDIDDYLFTKFIWGIQKSKKTNYVTRKYSEANKSRSTRYLHQEIIKRFDKIIIDHKNHNGLDNRRANLRICTVQQNQMNRQKRNNVSSIYKGVLFRKDKNKWQSKIKYNGKQYHLGYFSNEVEAAKCYDKAAILYFQEFALLNFGVKHE